ncbi:MAG: Crp/Fnr family transcriptional regulator [Phormidium tanganyikae FI6-MK23]|jgi:CRP-like cAMP-binding protein|nr:Crp/Fnr family transcriptional regulator [Phormidium tanganyikae FI6-MK23]
MRDSIDFSNFDQLPIQLQSVLTYQVLEAREHLFHLGEIATTLFAIKAGRIRLLHYTESGQIVNHYQVMVGEVLAEVILFLDHYACSAIAEERTEVLVFPKQAFLAALQHNPDFATSFMAQLTHRLYSTKVMLELRGIHSARDRVLHYLRFIVPPDQKSIVLEQPLKAIAYDLGISPESLSRALTQLENEGIIERDKRNLRLIR